MILFLILVAAVLMLMGTALICAVGGSIGGLIIFAEPIICGVIIVLIFRAFRRRRRKRKENKD